MKSLRIVVFFVLMSAAMMPKPVHASPPRDLQLNYNVGTHTLEVKMKHPTIEPREHYIRTITVSVNGAEAQIFHYTFQKLASEFDADIPLSLNSGDKVVVKATCRLGGSAEAELTIPSADDANGDAASSDQPQTTSQQTTNTYGK